MFTQEISAEARLAFEEWGALVRNTLEYQLGMGRAGTLRGASLIVRLYDKADFYSRFVKGSWKDSQALLQEIYAVIENSVEGSPLKVITDNIRRISKKSRAAQVKLSRIVVRLIASVLNQNPAAFESAVKDLIQLGLKS